MSPVAHHYAADNLLGMQLDGRLELVGLLGHGAQGDVLLARNMGPPGLNDLYTEDCYAVKVISKLGLDGRSLLHLQDEIVLHHRACSDKHPGVISLHNVIEAPNTLFLVSTFAPEGDLFERIINPLRPRLCTQPDTVRSIMLQLIDVVSYLHNEKGIAHRDIKPENLFWIETSSQSPIVKGGDEIVAEHRQASDDCEYGRLLIGDFGLATQDRFAADFGSGTSFYTSPEAAGYFRRLGLANTNAAMHGGALLSPIHLDFSGKSGLALPSPALADASRKMEWENRLSYDTFASDVWSIGIVLLNLICERNPWQHALSTDETFAAYAADPENVLQTVLSMLSDESHALLKQILKIDPRERISLGQMREEIVKIKCFVKEGTEEMEEMLVPYESMSAWLAAAGAHRQSTPASASPSSQVMSLSATTSSDWTSSNESGSGTSQHAKVETPMSSNGPSSGKSSMRPKRPLPVPLQINHRRPSSTASIPRVHLSAFPLPPAARLAPPSSARPASALASYPLRPPASAPIIKLTTASQSVLKPFSSTANPAEVVRLKMPPPPRKSKLSDTTTLFEPLSPGVADLVASVPCQMTLSSSTEGRMSEDEPVTPVDQMGSGVGGGRVVAEKGKEAQQLNMQEDDFTGMKLQDGEQDQWLSVAHRQYEGGNDDVPPVTPIMPMTSAKPPLTPLLLTPMSGRRYHPYGGGHGGRISGPTPTGRSILHSPLRMAQQAFLERHYAEYARPAGTGPGFQQHQQQQHYQLPFRGNDYLLNADMEGVGNRDRQVGGPRRGSLPV